MDGRPIVRPFYPGGDYENYEYPENCVVVDNPPFSILSNIVDFYLSHGVDFFLFAPGMLSFSLCQRKINTVIINQSVIYENGAVLNTTFITNMGDFKIRTSVELNNRLKKYKKPKKANLPKYSYPENVLTVNALQKLVNANVDISFKSDELHFTRALDSQKACKKAMYGAGFLISDNAKTRMQKAQAQAQAQAQTQSQENVCVWELSDREKSIIKNSGDETDE